jgi:hypothetical protein
MAGQKAVLTLPDPNTDVDVFFYKADCSILPYNAMAVNFIRPNTETGKVPADSAFVYASGFFGLNIAFTLTIG